METKIKSEEIRNREWASIYCPGCTEHIGDIGHQTKATLVCLSCGEITYAAVNADGLSILRGGSFDD